MNKKDIEMMKERDSRRDVSYFSKGIDFKQSIINKGRGKIYPRPEGQALHVSDLFDEAMELLIQRYGRGDSRVSLQDSVLQALEMRELMVNTLQQLAPEHPSTANMYGKLHLYNYYDSLALLCFVVALNDPQIDIERTLRAFDYTRQDTLLDKVAILLGDTQRSNKIGSKLVFHKMYAPLLAVVEAQPEQQSLLMKKFVEGWYKSMKPAAWHGNDQGGEGAYYGYWCFEAALVVNLLKIDDSSFRDNVYYPKDLVIR